MQINLLVKSKFDRRAISLFSKQYAYSPLFFKYLKGFPLESSSMEILVSIMVIIGL